MASTTGPRSGHQPQPIINFVIVFALLVSYLVYLAICRDPPLSPNQVGRPDPPRDGSPLRPNGPDPLVAAYAKHWAEPETDHVLASRLLAVDAFEQHLEWQRQQQEDLWRAALVVGPDLFRPQHYRGNGHDHWAFRALSRWSRDLNVGGMDGPSSNEAVERIKAKKLAAFRLVDWLQKLRSRAAGGPLQQAKADDWGEKVELMGGEADESENVKRLKQNFDLEAIKELVLRRDPRDLEQRLAERAAAAFHIGQARRVGEATGDLFSLDELRDCVAGYDKSEHRAFVRRKILLNQEQAGRLGIIAERQRHQEAWKRGELDLTERTAAQETPPKDALASMFPDDEEDSDHERCSDSESDDEDRVRPQQGDLDDLGRIKPLPHPEGPFTKADDEAIRGALADRFAPVPTTRPVLHFAGLTERKYSRYASLLAPATDPQGRPLAWHTWSGNKTRTPGGHSRGKEDSEDDYSAQLGVGVDEEAGDPERFRMSVPQEGRYNPARHNKNKRGSSAAAAAIVAEFMDISGQNRKEADEADDTVPASNASSPGCPEDPIAIHIHRLLTDPLYLAPKPRPPRNASYDHDPDEPRSTVRDP